MKSILAVVFSFLLILGIDSPAYSDEGSAELADIAVVTSNLVVQGTITVKDSPLPNSAVVNQTAVWEGQTYTFDGETGKISVRTVRETEDGTPSLTVVKVENGEVTFEYTDSRGAITIKKKIKPRE